MCCWQILYLIATGGDPPQPGPDRNVPPPHPERHESVQPASLCQVLRKVKKMNLNEWILTRHSRARNRLSKVQPSFCITYISFYSRNDLEIERPVPGSNVRTLKWVVMKQQQNITFCAFYLNRSIKHNISPTLFGNLSVSFIQVSFSAGGWRQFSCCGGCGELWHNLFMFTQILKTRL